MPQDLGPQLRVYDFVPSTRAYPGPQYLRNIFRCIMDMLINKVIKLTLIKLNQ